MEPANTHLKGGSVGWECHSHPTSLFLSDHRASEQRVRRACCTGRNSIQALKESDVGPNSPIFHLLCKPGVKSLCIYLMGKPEM